MDGLGFIDRIRKDSKLRETPIITDKSLTFKKRSG